MKVPTSSYRDAGSVSPSVPEKVKHGRFLCKQQRRIWRRYWVLMDLRSGQNEWFENPFDIFIFMGSEFE
jgi:hypothetical protein